MDNAISPVTVELQSALRSDTSPLLGIVHKSTVSPGDLFQRMPLHTFDNESKKSPQDTQPEDKESSLWMGILLSAVIIFVPFAMLAVTWMTIWKKRRELAFPQKISYFLAGIISCLKYVPFFLLIGEDIWSDFFCLLLLYLIFDGISIFQRIIEDTHVRAYKNKRLYDTLKFVEQRHNDIQTSSNLLIVVKGLLEAENMDIFASVFNYQVLEGNQENIEDIWNQICDTYSSAFLIKKHEQQSPTQMKTYEGKELLFMALTYRQDVFKIFFFGTYLVVALRLTAILVPLYNLEIYYTLIRNHSETFIGFAMTAFIFFYGLMPSFAFFMHILRENVRDYYGKTKWIAYLINIDIEKEDDFEDKPFKLNIFDENTLETWFITLILTRRAMTQRMAHVEKSTGLYLLYIILFGIFTGACYFIDVMDKEYFGYGFLFLLLPIDVLTILPPLMIYLYYGLKVNEYRDELSSILNSLVTLYEKMEDAVRDPNATNFEKSRDARYRYLWSCLVKSVGKISENDSFQRSQKLTGLKEKVCSIQRRFHEQYDSNPYKFCSLLECTMANYQVIAISAVGAVWSSIIGFVNQLLK